MSNQLDSVLGRSLSIRLNLQISLSSLPIVEEWMDVHLNRWLESVPLPPEMPLGHSAHFGVALTSDLSQLTWRAYGNPTGFVAKMLRYLDACQIAEADVALLDQMGNVFEPQLVGSWVAVVDGKIRTGWHFCDAQPFAKMSSLLAKSEGMVKLAEWLNSAGVDTLQRFSQSIGEEISSEIEFAIPGVSIDDQLSRLSNAFETLSGSALPEPVMQAMSEAQSPQFALGVCIADGGISRISAISPGLGNDMVAQLCQGTGVKYDNHIVKVQGALHAEEADRVDFCRPLTDDGAAPLVKVHLIPTDSPDSLPIAMN